MNTEFTQSLGKTATAGRFIAQAPEQIPLLEWQKEELAHRKA